MASTHMQVPAGHAHHLYNASIIASAPMIAASANAPYLFGHDLWDETRIPLFEQAVEVGGYAGAAHGPLRRVSFGSGFARHSIMECFEENLQHFPVLLPMTFEDAATLDHLRLHNGTIWRWNRPLIGFDAGGLPHIRIEHRVVPAGPTLEDSLANAAFFYGLAESLAQELRSHDGIRAGVPPISFAQAKDNFYQAARHGLKAVLTWRDERRTGVRELLLEQLLPRSREGLRDLGVTGGDIDHYLGIMRARVERGQNGCTWQRRWVEAHGRDMTALTAAYRDRQQTDVPVHEWYV